MKTCKTLKHTHKERVTHLHAHNLRVKHYDAHSLNGNRIDDDDEISEIKYVRDLDFELFVAQFMALYNKSQKLKLLDYPKYEN